MSCEDLSVSKLIDDYLRLGDAWQEVEARKRARMRFEVGLRGSHVVNQQVAQSQPGALRRERLGIFLFGQQVGGDEKIFGIGVQEDGQDV